MSETEAMAPQKNDAPRRPDTSPVVPLRFARNLAIALACVFIMVFVIILVGYGQALLSVARYFVGFFFHPLAVALVVLLGLEYIILKSADRTRLLQMELDKLRAKRRSEVTRLRKTREGLEQVKRQLQDPQTPIASVGEKIGELIEILRPPEARLLDGMEKEKSESKG